MDFQSVKQKLSKLQAENLARMNRLQQRLMESHNKNKDTCTSTWSQLQLCHPQVPPHPLAVPTPPPDHTPPVPCRPVLPRRQQAFRPSLASGQQELLPPVPPHDLCLRTPTPPTAPAASQTTNSRQVRSRLPRLKRTASLSVATTVTEQHSIEPLAGKTEEVREQKKVKRKKESKARQKRETHQARELPALDTLTLLPYPEQALLQAFWMLSSTNWEKKVEALICIRSLAQHHAELLLPRLHDLCLAIAREVKNLRSVVSCAAMVTLAHLCAHLGRGMNAEADGTARVLLDKVAEANNFIRKDAELALGYMVLNVTPSRSMNALINNGLRHHNAAVRKSTAYHLDKLVELMGLGHLLSGKKDLTHRVISAISILALDSAQEVRTHAQRTLEFLAAHPDLIEMVNRFIPEKDQDTIKDIIKKCQYRNLH